MVGKFETRKDTVQVLAESAANHVGRIASILTGAVRDVTHEVGEWASDLFEMREAAARAQADDEAHQFSGSGHSNSGLSGVADDDEDDEIGATGSERPSL